MLIDKYIAAFESQYSQRMNALSEDEFQTMRNKAFQSARYHIASINGYHICTDAILEDLHSEAWLKILTGNYEEVNGTFLANKMVWLYKDYRRKQRAEEQLSERYTQWCVDKQYVQSKLADVVEDARAGVREVMKLKLGGYTYDEIAERLNISKRTVNYRVEQFQEEARAKRIRNL